MEEPEFIKRQTSLSANTVSFCRYLRTKGYEIGPNETADALSTLEILNPFQQAAAFQEALRVILSKNRQQFLQFHDHFATYWKELERALNDKTKDQKEKNNNKQPTKQEALLAIKNWLYNKPPETEEQSVATYSKVETFTSKSFAAFTEEELQEVTQAIRQIARKLARQLARRWESTTHHRYLDIRRTLRLSLRRGGTVLDLAFQRPRKEKWKLVLLCDVSQSMELYSRFLIQFMYAFQQVYPGIETFTFSTGLTRITDAMREKDPATALLEVGNTVTNWSGGTEIGKSLLAFTDRYARRLVHKNTLVFILSDGWDIGDTESLASAMSIIHRRAHRVVWLNPLAGNPDFKPEVKGMAAALPYIDVLAPAHNLDSLQRLYRYL